MKTPSLASLGQLAGLCAFLAGLVVLAGIGWALLAGGAVVALVCIVLEGLDGPSAPRDGVDRPGVE